MPAFTLEPMTAPTTPLSAPTVWMTTLGCSKNQVDSDKISSVLGASGYVDALSPESADVVMVNTCGFIEDARRESVDTILELAAAKRDDAKLVDSMETKATYALVGFFTVAVIAAAFAFVFWMSEYGRSGPQVDLVVRIPGSANGLSVGSPVRFNGIQIGYEVLGEGEPIAFSTVLP